MKYIVIGLFFLLFSQPLPLFNCTSVFGMPVIDVIPSFVGYALVMKGTKELEPISKKIRKTTPWAKLMIVVSAVIWGMNVLGVGDGYIGSAASTLLEPVGYYIIYNIVKGIKEIEDYYQTNLESERLKKAYLRCIISLCVVVFIAATIPIALAIMILSGALNFVFNIYFYVRMFITKDLYDDIPPEKKCIVCEQNISNGDEI